MTIRRKHALCESAHEIKTVLIDVLVSEYLTGKVTQRRFSQLTGMNHAVVSEIVNHGALTAVSYDLLFRAAEKLGYKVCIAVSK